MWLKWLPWRYLVRRVARTHGLVDPISLLSQLHRFAEPSEVAAPMELLRAGVLFHARGLMNTGAIQHNLDWIWPYWVARQFDPRDVSFVPRAFSITHVNLTHRNWTAVGVPGIDALPIVDPRGLLTPHWDSWSLDAWVLDHEGRWLIPSELKQARQSYDWSEGLAVVTECATAGMALSTRAEVVTDQGRLFCQQGISARSDCGGWLIASLRPYNPEGVSFIHEAALADDGRSFSVERTARVEFDQPVDRFRFSNYRGSDVHARLPEQNDERHVTCDVGLVTAAGLFALEPGQSREVTVRTDLAADDTVSKAASDGALLPVTVGGAWSETLEGSCRLEVPDPQYQRLWEAAVRTLILHSPGDVYPGPYTYKRFWFRDAAFILHALLVAGLADRVERAIARFPARQTRAGYFLSQEGEWDSNGAALWVVDRFCQLTGRRLDASTWRTPIARGAKWIMHKRLSDRLSAPHAGLLPAGFSAEHLGPNNYYYWDDFWSIAGLRAAARLLERFDAPQDEVDRCCDEAGRLMEAVERSLGATAPLRDIAGLPASPYRRMDAGAIGSLAIGYPLALCEPDDPRLLETVRFLRENCFVDGGFFQDMIHSGINPYLTLHVAQVLLRAGDPGYHELVDAVARLASPTGQWPEAIHPRTGGGCMGDGQHVWAAAEWVLLMRNALVREEGRRLILAGGVPASWLEAGEVIAIGPTPTDFGDVSLRIEPAGEQTLVRWEAAWRVRPERIEIGRPGAAPLELSPDETQAVLERVAHE